MTAGGLPIDDDRLTVHASDPGGLLEDYAERTRIQASASVVRRFQAAVAEERAAERTITGRIRSLPLRVGIGRVARGTPARRIPSRSVAWFQGARFAFQLQGLALLLLLVLTLGLLAGGAGATIASLLQGPHRGSEAPAVQLVLPSATPQVPPSPVATVRVRPLAQKVPAPATKARKKAAVKRRPDLAWVTPACVADGRPRVSQRSCAF
jgi:hypothetical protein